MVRANGGGWGGIPGIHPVPREERIEGGGDPVTGIAVDIPEISSPGSFRLSG